MADEDRKDSTSSGAKDKLVSVCLILGALLGFSILWGMTHAQSERWDGYSEGFEKGELGVQRSAAIHGYGHWDSTGGPTPEFKWGPPPSCKCCRDTK